MGARYLTCLVVLAGFPLNSIMAAYSLVLQTKSGPIRGKLVQLGRFRQDVYEFTGIPYAEPPVGENRFKKPAPKTPWTDVFDATKPSTACIQPASGLPPYSAPLTELFSNFPGTPSEDCLYLNIWVPRQIVDSLASGSDVKPLPSYVFIHGAGFTMGSSSSRLFNGSVMSSFDNIIFASMNYRLAMLGFAYFGNNTDAPGNVGLWDQLEALKWISENIGAFGGNKSQVTIGGECAGGAQAVAFHLLSPYSRNYFQQAILESGSAIAPWGFHKPDTGLALTDTILNMTARAAGCAPSINKNSSIAEKLACLRRVDANALSAAYGNAAVQGYPVIDGDFVPNDPLQMLSSGNFYKAPLLMGANRNGEMHIVNALGLGPNLNPNASLDNLNFTQYDNFWAPILFAIIGSGKPIDPSMVDAIRSQYWPRQPPVDFPKGRDVLMAAGDIISDFSLACPTFNWAKISAPILKTAGNIPVYVYHFTERRSVNKSPEWMGVLHGEELYFVFGEPFASYAENYTYTSDEKILSKIMMEYWGNFIKYGNPNNRDGFAFCDPKMAADPNTCFLRNWPPYIGTTCENQIIQLNAPNHVYSCREPVSCNFKASLCSFWGDVIPKIV